MLRKQRICLALLAFALLFGINKSYSQEYSNVKTGQTQTSQTTITPAVIENFKKDVAHASSYQTINQVNIVPNEYLRSKVKVLSSKYLISPGDTLALTVYGEPDLAQPEILVRPDGCATIEPFGEISVAGLSVDELTNQLKTRFKSYLLQPKISVKVATMHFAKIYIYGAVIKPGLYDEASPPIIAKSTTGTPQTAPPAGPNLTLASVIASAGGIQYNADLRHIKVTNQDTGKEIEVDLKKLIENGDESQDIYLSSGDSVYIPPLPNGSMVSDHDFMLISSSSLAPIDFPVRIIGFVSKPGIYNLTSTSATVNSAIASAEGYTLDANKKVVAIQRMTSQGNVSTIFVDPNKSDIVLRPNDLIIVSDKRTSIANRAFLFLGNLISPFGNVAAGYNNWAEVFVPTRNYIK